MKDRFNYPTPQNVPELEDPAFLSYLHEKYPDSPIKPEKEDYDPSASPRTVAEEAHEYRLAQARRLLRIHQEWKQSQN